ncbi:DUF5060 domain-containing protein [Akkermansiaceae bacterium]|nr:DUF5060 domain-containing protein [Akkermansiaceae bacterium]
MKRISLAILATASLSFSQTYQESGGLVVMETENTPSALGLWQKQTSLSGHSGTGYLQFLGNTYETGPATSPLEYTFKINTAGLYYLHLHCAKETHDGRTDVANDCYVRVEGDYNAGPGPYTSHGNNASLALLQSNTKYFGGATNAWKWENGQNSSGGAGNLDPGGSTNKRVAAYDFKAGQTYKLVVSGRSKFFRINRIVFRHTSTSAATAQNLSTPESGTISGNLAYQATADFPNITGGTVPYYKDNTRNALAIDASVVANRDKYARAQRTFDGASGTYDVRITALRELDGECTYRFLVNGTVVGTAQNNTTGTDYAPQEHVFSNITIPSGATIAVESNTHSNGLVPETGGFAWARGRWTTLTLSTSVASLVQPPAGRLAYVSDGNSPDPDDIGANAVVFGLLGATGLQDRLVHFSHSCDLVKASNISAADELRRQNKLHAICGEGVGYFGPFPNLAAYYNCRTDQAAAVNNLRDAINASTASDPLWIIEAGEPDIIAYALQAATASKRQYVNVVSHHPANDNSGDFFTWQQVLDFGVIEHQIGDQNVNLQVAISSGLWDWAEGHSNPAIVWILDQLKYAEADGVVAFQTNKYDCSDAGMLYWWITGASNGGNRLSTPVEIKSMLLNDPTSAAQSVTGFTLINADTDQPIGALSDGDTLDLSLLPTVNLNVRADTSPTTVGSVRFAYDGNATYKTETTAPYALGGDTNGDYNPWTPTLGAHTLTATPFTGAGATGTAGTPLAINFNVVDNGGGTGATVTGELKKWHKLTFSWAGPSSSETAAANPFSDYRLNVTFSHPATGKTRTVPGYFAADGNAAETSAQSGNVWRAHFAPDETGEWTYSVSFRTGTDIAVSTVAAAGSSAGFFDGGSGTIQIAATDKTGRDLRGKGLLEYVGKHHLRFAETGEYFLKAGSDAPENFLAYDDFDDTPNVGGRRKSWSPHAADYDVASAAQFTWQGGKGSELLGAVRYLSDKGLNAFSFLTFSLDGDDDNVFPHLMKSTATAYQNVADNARWENANGVYHDRFDVSKMAQWERIFEYAGRMGMYLHFKTQETENDQKMDGGALARERKLYYRELLARFGHHLALNWNLGEENTNTTAQEKDFAQWFYDNDPYRHNIVLHTFPAQKTTVYTPLLGTASKLTGLSLQTDQADFSNVFPDTLTWVRNSANSGVPWVVACDEPGDAQHALRPVGDEGNSWTDGRKNALWGHVMAGGAGVEFYFGYGHANSDLTCQDYRSRDGFWDYCRHMLGFFRDNGVPFQDMANANTLVSGSGNNANRCLAKAGEAYVVQLYSGGNHTLDLSAAPGDFSVRWFDPRNGGTLQQGSVAAVTGGATVSLGTAPSATTSDWIVYLAKSGGGGDTSSGVMHGLPGDADVREDKTIVNLAAANLVPGRSGSNPSYNRSTHFVFELPNLGIVASPFLSATLGFNVETVSTAPPGVDLYGLGKRITADVYGTDYYGESATPDPTDATLIQGNILNAGTGTGLKTSNASTALASYLNAQYDGGNGIGKYVFLRLSTTAPVPGLERHFVTSADATGTNGPRINYTAVTPQDFDSWLGSFPFAPGADLTSGGDPDHDGLSTWFEYLFGLDPSDCSSVNPVTIGLSQSDGTFTYTRRNPALTGITDYQVWVSENLSGWEHDSAALQATGDIGEIQVVAVTLSGSKPLTAPSFFIRVRASN